MQESRLQRLQHGAGTVADAELGEDAREKLCGYGAPPGAEQAGAASRRPPSHLPGCANAVSPAQSTCFGAAPAMSTSLWARSSPMRVPAGGAAMPRSAQGIAISTAYPDAFRTTETRRAVRFHDRFHPADEPRSSVTSPLAFASTWKSEGERAAAGAPRWIITSMPSPSHTSPSDPPLLTTSVGSLTSKAAYRAVASQARRAVTRSSAPAAASASGRSTSGEAAYSPRAPSTDTGPEARPMGYSDPATRFPSVTTPQRAGWAKRVRRAQSAGLGAPPATSTSSTATSMPSRSPAQGAIPMLDQGTATSTSYPAAVRTSL